MINQTVAVKSAWKSTVVTFVMALGVAILSAVADFVSDTNLIASFFTNPQLQMLLVPVFAWLGAFLKDYIKHA